MSGNACVPFTDWTLWADRVYYPFGHERPGATRVLKPTRRLRFEPGTQIFTEGVVDYSPASGETRQLHYERIGQQTAYLRCGMYGGTPGGDIHQGGYDGPGMTGGETYDVTDMTQRISLRGLDEHLCRVMHEGETVIGVYQTIDPVVFEACTTGRPGWDFL